VILDGTDGVDRYAAASAAAAGLEHVSEHPAVPLDDCAVRRRDRRRAARNTMIGEGGEDALNDRAMSR